MERCLEFYGLGESMGWSSNYKVSLGGSGLRWKKQWVHLHKLAETLWLCWNTSTFNWNYVNQSDKISTANMGLFTWLNQKMLFFQDGHASSLRVYNHNSCWIQIEDVSLFFDGEAQGNKQKWGGPLCSDCEMWWVMGIVHVELRWVQRGALPVMFGLFLNPSSSRF